MMEIHLITLKDWALLALIIGFLFTLAYAWGKEAATEDKQVRLHLDPGEIALMNKGYVFGTLWSMEMLKGYAHELGVVFTIEDYAKIIKMLKDDFKEDEGINKGIILTCMRIYIAYHSDRSFRLGGDGIFDPHGPYDEIKTQI